MRIGVVDQPHIHMLEGTVVSHTVLLKGLGVKDRDLQAPHHRYCPQHYLITPELPLQQLVEVLSVAEGTSMDCSQICDAIGSSQCRVHIEEHFLPIFHHPVHHLAMKVTHPQIQDVLSQIIFTMTQHYSHISSYMCHSYLHPQIQDVVYKYNAGGYLKYSLSR